MSLRNLRKLVTGELLGQAQLVAGRLLGQPLGIAHLIVVDVPKNVS